MVLLRAERARARERDRKKDGASAADARSTPPNTPAHTPTNKPTPPQNNSLADATAKASKEFKEYAHCLDLTAGKYAYCRPEKAKFETAFPLLKDE